MKAANDLWTHGRPEWWPQPCNERPNTSGRRLRTPDAARYLGISSWMLRHKAHHGEIPVLKQEKYWLFDTRDLDEWLDR